MTENTELKRLAEAQPVKEWSRDSGRQPDMPGRELMFSVEGPVGVSDYEDWGFARSAASYIAAADPAAILALIAENDALAGLLKRFVDGEHEQDENQAERHMYFTEAQSLLALVSGELEAHTIVPDSAIKAIHAERDQLRAEIAGLRTGYEAYERVNAELKAEVEGLRKDADLLQSATAFVQKLCDSAGKQPSVATGYLHDILSALGQGEQS